MAAPAPYSCWMCRVKQVTSPCCRWGLNRSSAPRLAPSTDDGEQDRISALPDHLIHLFLARLGCARAAAHTSLVSQRWRHLWASLHELTFHDTPPAQIEAALARIADPSVTLLDITVPNHHELRPAGIASLLRSAARVAPAELSVMVPVARHYVFHPRRPDDVELPCFDSTTSISLSAVPIPMTIRLALLPPAGNFRKLESLTLFSCDVEISDMLPRCPRLRKLYILRSRLVAIVSNSRSLEELEVVIEGVLLQHVHIHAPLLKKLIILATSGISNDEFTLTSFSAPILEELVWSLGHESASVGFGIWFMSCLTFEMPKHLASDKQESTSQQQHCPGVNELCMSIGTRLGFLGDVPRSFNKMMSETCRQSFYFGFGYHGIGACLRRNSAASTWGL